MRGRSCLTVLFSAFFLASAATVVSTQPQSQPQSPRQFSDTVKGFIKVDAPVVALTNVRIIDGTGAPARAGQTIIIKGGVIAAVGDAGRVQPPAGSTVLDLAGQTVMPGLVMVHEHLYYPTGPGV